MMIYHSTADVHSDIGIVPRRLQCAGSGRASSAHHPERVQVDAVRRSVRRLADPGLILKRFACNCGNPEPLFLRLLS